MPHGLFIALAEWNKRILNLLGFHIQCIYHYPSHKMAMRTQPRSHLCMPRGKRPLICHNYKLLEICMFHFQAGKDSGQSWRTYSVCKHVEIVQHKWLLYYPSFLLHKTFLAIVGVCSKNYRICYLHFFEDGCTAGFLNRNPDLPHWYSGAKIFCFFLILMISNGFGP